MSDNKWNYKIKDMKTVFLLARFDSHNNGESLNFRTGDWTPNPALISALWGDSDLLEWDDISKQTAIKYIKSSSDLTEEIKRKIIQEMESTEDETEVYWF